MSISHAEIQAVSAAKVLAAAQDLPDMEQAREMFRQAERAAIAKAEEMRGVEANTPSACFLPLLKVKLQWADAEKGRSQFKAAKRIYEELVTHSVLKNLAATWLSYAGFCASRGKVKGARKVYVRGCQNASLPEEQSNVLYNAFLNFENAILSVSSPLEKNLDSSSKSGAHAASAGNGSDCAPHDSEAGEGVSRESAPHKNSQDSAQPASCEEESVQNDSNAPKLLTMDELRALVGKTALPTQDVTVVTTKSSTEALSEKFSKAEASGQVVVVEDVEGEKDAEGEVALGTDHGSNIASLNVGDKSVKTGMTYTTSGTVKTEDINIAKYDSFDAIPGEIVVAASRGAATEMRNYALPSGNWAPRLFLTPGSVSGNGSGSKMQKLPRETMIQLGTSLKEGGAQCVFEIVAKLREYQRLKEEALRLRRQAIIKEYRIQVAMAWLKSDANNKIAGKSGKAEPDPALLGALAEKLKKGQDAFDIMARRELETMRRYHQSLCEKIGIPEMRPTPANDVSSLKRQRQVLELIERAGKRMKK